MVGLRGYTAGNEATASPIIELVHPLARAAVLSWWRDLANDHAVKNYTEWMLWKGTGLYFPTGVVPTGMKNGQAWKHGNVVHNGLDGWEGVGVHLHEDAHNFWKDLDRPRGR